MSINPPLALIAEDEPLLALSLQQELQRAWPELRIAAAAGDGNSAVAQALALLPDVLFFDIRMPGQSGLEAAAELADESQEEAELRTVDVSHLITEDDTPVDNMPIKVNCAKTKPSQM